MLLSEALKLFETNYINLRGLSSDTQENYQLAIGSFIRACGDIQVESLAVEHILVWKRKMEKTNKIGTVRLYMSKLKNIIKFTNKQHVTNFDLDNIPLPKVPIPLPKYLTAEEVTLLIDTAWNVRDKAIISLLFASGMRAMELCNLTKTAIQGHEITIEQGKKGSSRVVFMDDRTRVLLDMYLRERLDNTDILFYSAKHGKLQTCTINRLIRLIGRQAKLDKPIHTHMLRHSFATNMLRGNMNLRYIQEMMGHAFVSTTQIYTHVIKGDMYEAYKKAHKIA